MSSISMLYVIAHKFRVIPVNSTGDGVKIVKLEEMCQTLLNAGVAWSNELRHLCSNRDANFQAHERDYKIGSPRLRLRKWCDHL